MQNKNSPVQSENMIVETSEESKNIVSASFSHPNNGTPMESSNSENIKVSSENKYDNTTKDPSVHEEDKRPDNESPYLTKSNDSKGNLIPYYCSLSFLPQLVKFNSKLSLIDTGARSPIFKMVTTRNSQNKNCGLKRRSSSRHYLSDSESQNQSQQEYNVVSHNYSNDYGFSGNGLTSNSWTSDESVLLN